MTVGGVDDWPRWLTEKQCAQIVEVMKRHRAMGDRRTSAVLMFSGPFLLEPPEFWSIDWAGDIVGTLVYLNIPGHPQRVWRLTGKREYDGGVVNYEGVWPD